jgi:hypothetical protein
MKSKEKIELLSKEEYPTDPYYEQEILCARDGFMKGYKAALKEEVSWDEAINGFTKDEPYNPYALLIFLEENYTLTPKSKK